MNRAWRWYACCGLVSVVAYLIMPVGWPRDIWYAALGLSTIVVLFLVGRRIGGRLGLAWALLGAGQLASVLGDAAWAFYAHVLHLPPYPSGADLIYLAEYPLTVGGLFALARARRGHGEREALLDSAIITAGLGLVYWVLLIHPTLDGRHGSFEQIVELAYPVSNIVLLAALAWLLVAAGARTLSFRLLTGAIALILIGDVVFLATAGSDFHGVDLGSVPYLVAYVMLGAAALHPSVRTVHDESGRVLPFSARRLALLTTVVLLVPGTLAVQLIFGLGLSAWPVTLASAALFVLLVVRMAVLLRRLQQQAHRLDEIARTDMLTGLPNRRTMDAELARTCVPGRAAGPVTVAMIDLDRFKNFNDAFGHQAGDRLLADAAAAWTTRLGARDVLARYGGEEFVLLMPGRDVTSAFELVTELRAVTPERQTFSAGLARWNGAEPPADTVHRADIALYSAKESGRNRIRTAAQLALEPVELRETG